MPERVRDVPQMVLKGTKGANSSPQYDDTTTLVKVGWSYCKDWIGPGDNYDLTVDRRVWEGGRINKAPGGSSTGSWFRQYLCDYALGLSNIYHPHVPGVPSHTDVATSAAARTNPSRPYVDLPVAIKELADIPLLVRDSGRTLIHKLAGANLKYQFGIAPLASDIAKLVKFQDAYNFRVKELNRLFGEKGLRRTVSIGEYTTKDSGWYTTLQSEDAYIRSLTSYVSTVKIRAHCRWKPAMAIPNSHMVPKTVRKRLFEAMLGISGNRLNLTHVSQLWEALPWTWLVDWCGSVGDFLMSQRNIIPAELSSVKVITHRKTELWFEAASSSNGAQCSKAYCYLETKTRNGAVLAPIAHLNILSDNQVGILASLLAIRRR